MSNADRNSIDPTNFDAARQFVEFGLAKKKEGERESASGPGSAYKAAQPAISLLEKAIRDHNVERILDLGCGDWNWMKSVNLRTKDGRPIQYLGWDAHADLIQQLNNEYGSSNVCFELSDATQGPLPEADLVIARDILFHMNHALGVKLVSNAKVAAPLFLSTSFLEINENAPPKEYLPIENWGFHKVNLNRAPYDLGSAMIAAFDEPEGFHSSSRRYICLYDFRLLST